MRALRFDTQLELRHDAPAPRRLPGEALLRPLLLGICNTDTEITRGYKGFCGTLGHEFVAVVEDCDDPSWLGARVVGEINVACGRCPTCQRGEPTHCPQRAALGIFGRDGAMADLFALPLSNLHRVPASLPDTVAVFAEPLAAALEILEQSHLRPSECVAVVGDGKLGLLVAQVLRLPGCAVTLVGRHPDRWAVPHALGIDAAYADTLDARSFDVVVDCTGSPAGLEAARRLLRPRGRLVLKSTYAGAVRVDLSVLVVDELTLVGSRCGPFAPALRLLEGRLVETAPLIADVYALDDGLAAFEAAQHALKILLKP
jgi:alcohol dehydrogenase